MGRAKFLFLGCGSSLGVPVIGCDCAVCRSTSSFNKRLRPAVLIRSTGKRILIDPGPDLRAQALKHKLDRLDGVMLTHAHHDHTAGIDDLRAYYLHTGKPIPCLLSGETFEEIKARYSYLFAANAASGDRLISRLSVALLPAKRGQTDFCGLSIRYFSFEQQKMVVNGYRFGSLAYVTDIKEYPETIFEDLEGVKDLVISAPRFEGLSLHFNIAQAISFAERMGAANVWLTHLAHEIDYEKEGGRLPSNTAFAYDGLEIDFAYD